MSLNQYNSAFKETIFNALKGLETFVMLEPYAIGNKKFTSMEEAVTEAEEKRYPFFTATVFTSDNVIGDCKSDSPQDIKRNSRSGDLVYYTWTVFSFELDDSGKINYSEIIADVDSEREALAIANAVKKVYSYLNVAIQQTEQTLSEYIGSCGEPQIIKEDK